MTTDGTPAAPEGSPGHRSGEKVEQVEHRQRPRSEAFKRFIAAGWGPRPSGLPQRSDAAGWAAARRGRLSELFPGERLVVPAGGLRVRRNDTHYPVPPHSAVAHPPGLGTDPEPGPRPPLQPPPGAPGGGPDGGA